MAKVSPSILEYNAVAFILKEIALSILLAKCLTNKQKTSFKGKDEKNLNVFIWIKITVEQA